MYTAKNFRLIETLNAHVDVAKEGGDAIRTFVGRMKLGVIARADEALLKVYFVVDVKTELPSLRVVPTLGTQ